MIVIHTEHLEKQTDEEILVSNIRTFLKECKDRDFHKDGAKGHSLELTTDMDLRKLFYSVEIMSEVNYLQPFISGDYFGFKTYELIADNLEYLLTLSDEEPIGNKSLTKVEIEVNDYNLD